MDTGCYIDGSHWSSFDFTTAVIDFAVERGFEIDDEQYKKDLEDYRNDLLDEDILYEVLESLDWTYAEALDYLNGTAPDNLIWFVEDQSLFLEESDDL